MLELTATWRRRFTLAALAWLLAIGTAVAVAYRAVGPAAALALLAVAAGVVLALTMSAARRALRRVDERAQLGELALDAAPQAVFIVEALTRGRPNLYVNAAYCALTGYAAREALGPGFDALRIFLEPPVERDEASAQRVTIRLRNGTTVSAMLTLRATSRANGRRRVVGFVEADGVSDAPDRNGAAPPDRPPASADGEHARDAFLSWLSHELRSPLNACVMWLDVLALSPQPDKLTKAVETIKRNLARQARLINDLNDAAKISRGGIEVRPERLDIVAVLTRGLDVWRSLASAKQVTFQHHFELATASIDGDSDRLFQALNHLVESAIGSTPHGGSVDMRLRAADGNCLIEIEDTGAALSPDDAAHLSVPLWRSPASAKTRSSLGLGLAIAHDVVTKHGGSLTADSGGSGGRFVLTVPLAASGHEATGVPGADRKSSL